MNDWFITLIFLWSVLFMGLLTIGGFFMFRKFLKRMPKQDGKSELDWQEYYIKKALPLWNDEAKHLLNELVSPVPELFRQVAKERIAGRISKIALDENAKTITLDHILRGYIIATPKRDHPFMKKKLNQMNIDYAPYEDYFKYADDEKKKFSIFEHSEIVHKEKQS
ncbi:DUF2621 domain-containing protein [Macrococcus armenti]|uniref:DUF2621 domain-containing protein n=1 Tax=Macrococcus armenti TaxID=2875764 RepID=UPI001CCDE11A|nr:DUF2621 domain-containing protein [Macrococcus armenti]UBH09641.1 DUF2621 domain-containing protein [Macrococcus armenti]UBH11915.1 DUF2621 domain-containing protein [Macrococcus armenti]UBH16446.1 DUF2621 domain-containing protein [Macrococcus armenti]UBH18802.1 DUF2621 domain-containing protein [Macrococcus armenti]UBH21074.1 DUF2621 domain-containing protein [Macrococcus armenti]